MSKYAWVTLTTNDTYSLGALVLAHSLKRVSTAHQLAVLVTPGVSESMRNRLKDVYNVVQEVNILDSQDTANLALLARPELGITFTKLHCWKLVQFEKCVFLDADILVIKNCDELFDREELSAAPDISWPDCFNSGVFVYRPNLETFSKLIKFALENGSFDGGDQGLLNQYFSDWSQKDISKHLPFIYNTHAFASYSYLPAFKQFRDSIKILHFAGRFKPWLANFNSETKTAYPPQEFQHAYDLIQLWWDIYCSQVHHSLSDQMNYFTTGYYTTPIHVQDYVYFDYPNYQSVDVTQNVISSKDFYDPWEDYYENLQNATAPQSENNWQNVQNIHCNIYNESNQSANQNNQSENQTNVTLELHVSPQNDRQDVSFDQGYLSHSAKQNENNVKSVQAECSTSSYQQENLNVSSAYSQEVQNFDTHHLETVHSDLSRDRSHTEDVSHSSYKHHEHRSSEHRQNIEQSTQQQEVVDTSHRLEQHIPTYQYKNSEHSNAERNIEQTQCIEAKAHEHNKDEVQITKPLESNTNTDMNYNIESEKPIVSPTTTEEETKNESLDSTSPNSEVGLAGALSKLRLGEARTPEQEAYEQHIRRQCWEAGNIDYTGKDSFDNIWKKITQTLESGKKETQPLAQSDQDKSERVLTSADIEDGKTEYDPETNATITYKKVPKGYQQIITTPQPNGTTKTQTKTFYDPVPMSAEEIEEENRLNKKSNNKNKGNSTVEIKKIPGGHEEITTTVYPDGTTSIKTKTVYDAQEVVESSNQQVVQDNQKNKKTQQHQVVSDQQQVSTQKKTTQKVTQQQQLNQQQVNQQQLTQQQLTQQQLHQQQLHQQQVNQQQLTQQQLHQQQVNQQQLHQQQLNQQQQLTQQQLTQQQVTSQQVTKVSAQEQRTQKIQMQHQSTFEEVSHFSQTTEVSGKSITTQRGTIEEQNIQSITEKKDKKKKTTTKNTNAPPAPPKIVDKPGEKTSVVTKKITGGTEYHYTTVKEDGTVVTSIKTVYEEEEVEMTEREIKEYKKQLKEAEKHKNVTKTTTLPSKVGTKKVIPSENPGEVTTVEEVKIQGGTEYHYTTVTAEGIVKKSSKTIYDPVPVAGESDEEEIIEEYEEEIIEPGEPIVTTTRSTKPLNDDDKKKLAQDAPASKKKEKKSGRK